MQMTESEKSLLEIGYRMATEPNFMNLFHTILDGCIRFTNADGGSLYIKDDEGDQLVHLMDINHTLDAPGRHSLAADADMQPAENKETNLFTYTYHSRKMLNIEDVYDVKGFDVLAIREFDARNQYRTQSVLMAPINALGSEVLGVMMLYNSMDEQGNAIPFTRDCERAVASFSAQMVNTLTNLNHIQDLEELLGSFVQCLTTAIDAKTPYNANHTRHVEGYCMELVNYINARHTRGDTDLYITEMDKTQLSMAAMLHDIGKVITPREVLNKSTRLGSAYDALKSKLEKIRLMKKIDMLEGRLDKADWTMEDLQISNFLNRLDSLNTCGYLTDDDIRRVDEIGEKIYIPEAGEPIPYLDEAEKESLHIRRGTLTDEERKIVQEHVVYTDRILADIKFTKKHDKVRRIAANHHEYLDGSGYPKGLKADDLDLLTRILTVCDIFDSLRADDRPYKKPLTLEKALDVLQEMADEGKLDPVLVNFMKEMKQNSI